MEVTFMRLADFLSSVRPAYGGTWAESLKLLNEDRFERQIIRALMKEYTAAGKFKEPVCLYVMEDDKGDSPFYNGVKAGDMVVGNGMHRVAALCNLRADTVAVTYTWPEGGVGTVLEFYLEGEPETIGDEDIFDVAFGCMRSFKLGDKWVEADGFGSSGELFHAGYNVESIEASSLVASLQSRLEKVGLRLSVVRVVDEDAWLAE